MYQRPGRGGPTRPPVWQRPAGQRAGTETGFSEVSAGDYFAQAVEWAVGEEITQGTGGGWFSPDSTVTRAEAVTFLWRAQGRPEPGSSVSPFTDVTDKNAYYDDAVRQGQTEVTIQVSDGTRDYKDIVREAYNTVNYNNHEIDGLVAGEDYNIWTKSGGSNTSTWTIVYC